MDWWWFVIAIPVIAVVGGAITNALKTSDFASLGNVTGKSLSDITKVVGEPNSVSATGDGTLYQWIGINGGSSYHYAILFDMEGKAVGFTHQHVS